MRLGVQLKFVFPYRQTSLRIKQGDNSTKQMPPNCPLEVALWPNTGHHHASPSIMNTNLCQVDLIDAIHKLFLSTPPRPVEPCPGNHNVHQEESSNDSGFGSSGFSVYKPLYDCNTEIEKLHLAVKELNECCFYYGSVSSQEARVILCKKPIGTFLLRDSSDSRYLYSLSLKTERGATSVRIVYSRGLFQFDSDERIRNKLPCFESVLALVDFHVMVSQSGNNKSWRWEENSGKKSMKVNLKEPLKCSVPSLAHLSRIKINQCLEDVYMPQFSVDKLLISMQLKDYLKAYPYRV
ncbi:suppressor of cytokine signaling 2 [Biomphalaria glabrata]|uniref:Suppressor of cytokine signaling 2-like isoform X1 n=2 Tax=Biomphalaria glabrata TaxID=6526 RepID=A0A9U8DW86_BIOGL|nr:suppressor of cytokine signaling 2-like isoform X1 [Biomphalaria glabrata]